MKKLLALLLALALMLSASLVLAEENKTRDPQEYPFVAIGADYHYAFEVFDFGWKAQYSFSKEPAYETKTLSDGTEITVATFAAEPSNGFTMPTTVRLYILGNRLAAAMQEIEIPEGSNPSVFKTQISQTVMNTDPVTLDTSKIGNALEMLGEAAHLEDGQAVWPYDVSGVMKVNSVDTPASFSAMLAFNVVDNTIYLAEFPYAKPAATTAATKQLAEMEGFDKLTAEEQNAVALYADFLQKQQNDTLKQYIDFLLQKHQ